MNQTETGKLIAKCRKSRGLTQAQLAEKLNITDRAVSKWETGKSMPDPSVMLKLCQILGITADELLSGEKAGMEISGKEEDENLIAVKRREKPVTQQNRILAALFSAALLLGIMVCLICDVAVFGRFTWSLIPAGSIVFAWVIAFPGILLGKRGMIFSLLTLTVFTVPYLFLLSRLIKAERVFSIGAATAAASLAFLWVIAAVFHFIGRRGKGIAWGMTFLLAIPFLFLMNGILSHMIAEPVCDLWDLLSVFVLLILAFVSFVCHRAGKRGPVK